MKKLKTKNLPTTTETIRSLINIPQTHHLVQAPLCLVTAEETENQEPAHDHGGNQKHEGQGQVSSQIFCSFTRTNLWRWRQRSWGEGIQWGREAGNFSGLDQPYWLSLCTVQATRGQDCAKFTDMEAEAQGCKEHALGHTKDRLYSMHCLLPGAWTSHH